MRQFKRSKTHAPILAALLGLTIFTLTACGQRGPLKLPEPTAPAAPAKQVLPESPAK